MKKNIIDITEFNQRIEFIRQKIKKKGEKFDPKQYKDILELKDNKNYTIAHVMALNGYRFDPDKHIDILKWKDNNGYTVADMMEIPFEDIEDSESASPGM